MNIKHFNFIEENPQLKITITSIIMIFTILDIVVTLGIGFFTLLAPGLTITVFKREPTLFLLVIIIAFMVILSAKPLVKKIQFFIIRLILGTIITLFILYSSYSFLTWYFLNIEGTFDFRFLTFTKTASLEDKMNYYHTAVASLIETIRSKDSMLAKFLEQNPAVMNPNRGVFMRTSFELMPQLAQQNISAETYKYLEMMKQLSKQVEKSDLYFYLKIFGIIAGSVLTFYFLYQFNVLETFFKKVKKGWELLGKTQDEMKKLSNQLIKDSKTNLSLELDFKKMNDLVSAIGIELKNITLESATTLAKTDTLVLQMERAIQLINQVIRPCMQSLFVGFKTISNDEYLIILKSLTKEQKDFLTPVSSLIFK